MKREMILCFAIFINKCRSFNVGVIFFQFIMVLFLDTGNQLISNNLNTLDITSLSLEDKKTGCESSKVNQADTECCGQVYNWFRFYCKEEKTVVILYET